SAELAGTLDDARRFLERCRLFALAESLGGVESLIEHPALMTHGSVPADARAALGIGDTLVRLSGGVENTDDLLADLAAAPGEPAGSGKAGLGSRQQAGRGQLQQRAAFGRRSEPLDIGVAIAAGMDGAVAQVGRILEPEILESVTSALVGEADGAAFDRNIEILFAALQRKVGRADAVDLMQHAVDVGGIERLVQKLAGAP